MRKLLWIIVILLLVIGGLVAFLVLTTGTRTTRIALGSTPESLRLLHHASERATEIGFIGNAAPLYRAARAHPFAAELIRRWEEEPGRKLLPLLLGRSDVVFWREEGRLSYVTNPDPVRLALVRAYLRFAGSGLGPVAVERGLLRVGPSASLPVTDATLSNMLRLSEGERADMYVFQSSDSRASYPPVARPALTAVYLDDSTIRLRSRAVSKEQSVQAPLPMFYPANAMLVAAASASPKWFAQIDRLLPIGIASFLDRGALMALYRVDDKTLVPRVFGAIILPESKNSNDLIRVLESIAPRLYLGPLGSIEESRRLFRGTEIVRREGFGYTIEYARARSQVVVAFDKASVEQFLLDTVQPIQLTARQVEWFVRIRPENLAPVVDQLRDRKELSLLVPELYETISDLDLWLSYFPGRGSVLIAKSREGELEVTEAILQAEK